MLKNIKKSLTQVNDKIYNCMYVCMYVCMYKAHAKNQMLWRGGVVI